MGKIRQFWLLTGVLVVAILGAGYFFGVKPQSAKAETVKSQTATQASANMKLKGEIQLLQKQAAGVVGQQNRLRQIAVILPSNPALPKLIRSMTSITVATGVDFQSMAPGALELLSAPVTAAPKKVVTDAKGEASTTPKARPTSQAAGGLAAMPVAMTLTGNFAQVQLFISKLEKLDRAFVVESLKVEPAKDASAAAGSKKKQLSDLSVTLVGRVFVKSAPSVIAAPAPAKPSVEK